MAQPLYIEPESSQIVAFLDKTLDPTAIDAARNALPGLQLTPMGRHGTRAKMPGHAAPFLGPVLRALDAKVVRATGNPNPPAPVPWETLSGLLEHNGELRDSYRDDWVLPYQREALEWAARRAGALLHHPTGSGKTYTGIVWSLLDRGPVLVVTRAVTRVQFARQYERFTKIRPFLCKPETKRRKKDKWQTLDEYWGWCSEHKQRPVVVVGWASLSSWFERLRRFPFHSIIYDEIHKGKGGKRWEAVPIPDRDDPKYREIVQGVLAKGGSVKPDERKGGEIGFLPLNNIVYCASQLSKKAKRRLGMTATPIPDRVRDLWGEFDLIEPFLWGRKRDFGYRYCAGTPGTFGGFDDRGKSNLDELAQRMQWVIHSVPGKVARAMLPPKRRETWYIPPSEQVEPSGGWKRAIKAAAKAGHTALLEVRLAMAASSKRRALLSRIAEHMESGHKVVVFTARTKDCEELANNIRKLKGKSAPKAVWSGHGGDSQKMRQQMLAEYIACEGSCVLVGTGQAWGTGIDGMQCTDAAIFARLPYTPGELDQWEGRFTRHGQDRPVTIYFPIAEGTADEHLASILLEKLPAVDQLAPSDALDGAADALSGHEDDPEKFAAQVLSALNDQDEDDDWD